VEFYALEVCVNRGASTPNRARAVDALLEDRVGEALVGEGPGDLDGRDHQREETKRLQAGRRRIVRRPSGRDVID
jgi:hypothetical protein